MLAVATRDEAHCASYAAVLSATLPGPFGMLKNGRMGVGIVFDITALQELAAVSTPPGSYTEATFHCRGPGGSRVLRHSVARLTMTGAGSATPVIW